MRKVILYIAQSLDGKIATPEGATSWLHDLPNPNNSDYGYSEFIESIDTTLMGRKTFEIVTGFDLEFPYKRMKNFVFTSAPDMSHPYAKFVNNQIEQFVSDLKKENGKDIWLIGGAQLLNKLLAAGLVDKMIIFTMPIILGKGISMFDEDYSNSKLQLSNITQYQSGAIRSVYELA